MLSPKGAWPTGILVQCLTMLLKQICMTTIPGPRHSTHSMGMSHSNCHTLEFTMFGHLPNPDCIVLKCQEMKLNCYGNYIVYNWNHMFSLVWASLVFFFFNFFFWGGGLSLTILIKNLSIINYYKLKTCKLKYLWASDQNGAIVVNFKR